MAEIKQYIRTLKNNGDVILSNMLDSFTGESVEFIKVTDPGSIPANVIGHIYKELVTPEYGTELFRMLIDGDIPVTLFGAKGDGITDNTEAFANAIIFSNFSRQTIFVPFSTSPYLVRGIDFKGFNRAKLKGEASNEFSYSTIATTGTPSIIDTAGDSIFVRINDDLATGVRDVIVENLILLESAGSLRNRGLVAMNSPQMDLNNLQLNGFDKSLRIARLWNSKANYIHCYNYRVLGLSSSEGDNNWGNTNGLELLSFHASTPNAAEANIDLRGCNSISFFNLTTEGECISHFLVDASCRSIGIHGIHKEGGVNFLEVDIDTSAPTFPFCSFSIFGGAIFITRNAASGDGFIKVRGTRPNVGLQQLTLHGVTIDVYSTITLPTNYFDCSRVAILDTTATFRDVTANPTINALEWLNVGKSVNNSWLKGQLGHNGKMSSLRKTYTGDTGEFKIVRRGISSATMAAGTVLTLINTDLNQYISLDIQLEIAYSTAPFAGRVFAARWIGHIAYDGTLLINTTYVNDVIDYADRTTFTYDRATKELKAASAIGIGTFNFKVKVLEN